MIVVLDAVVSHVAPLSLSIMPAGENRLDFARTPTTPTRPTLNQNALVL
jgi:hypothetical protein